MWSCAVILELWAEYQYGPFSAGLLTDTVVVKTGEAASVLKGNSFSDLVPVDQAMNKRKFLLTLLGPTVLMWVLGFAWAWVAIGFKRSRVGT